MMMSLINDDSDADKRINLAVHLHMSVQRFEKIEIITQSWQGGHNNQGENMISVASAFTNNLILVGVGNENQSKKNSGNGNSLYVYRLGVDQICDRHSGATSLWNYFSRAILLEQIILISPFFNFFFFFCNISLTL